MKYERTGKFKKSNVAKISASIWALVKIKIYDELEWMDNICCPKLYHNCLSSEQRDSKYEKGTNIEKIEKQSK